MHACGHALFVTQLLTGQGSALIYIYNDREEGRSLPDEVREGALNRLSTSRVVPTVSCEGDDSRP